MQFVRVAQFWAKMIFKKLSIPPNKACTRTRLAPALTMEIYKSTRILSVRCAIKHRAGNAVRSAASLPAEYNKKMTTPEEKIVRLYWVLEKMYWLERLEEAVCQLESEIAAEHSVQTDTPSAMDSRAILINTACS